MAASAPLLQGWFAASGHVQARNPYVLYAASNLGSFAALIAYPFVIEPFLTAAGAGASSGRRALRLLALLVAVASLLVARRPSYRGRGTRAPRRRRRRCIDLTWAALAAIPVGLVIAVTSYITTDIASAPFLWVLPLALYLLTFVAVFRDPPWLRQETVAAPGAVPGRGRWRSACSAASGSSGWSSIVVNLAAFVLLALLCHGELYRRRPAPALLTEFYLWMSLGGVVGGIFAALVAPQIFTLVYEYPILIVAAAAGSARDVRRRPQRILAEAAPGIGARRCWPSWRNPCFDLRLPGAAAYRFQIVLVGLAAIMLLQRRRPQRFLALVVLGFVLTGLWQPGFNRIAAVRSFFGVHQIVETADGRFRLLYHGTTVHGAERIADTDAAAPRRSRSPIIISAVRSRRASKRCGRRAAALRHVAVVGLGSGTLSCYRRGDEQWTFFEIDPEVAQIARDPRLFTYVSACAPDLPVVLGDARLTLAASPAAL